MVEAQGGFFGLLLVVVRFSQTRWTWAVPAVPVNALETQCLVKANFACWSYRAARDTSQGNVPFWQNHRLTKMMCFKCPFDCKGESISLLQSCWCALFCMGCHPAGVLLSCMFVKKAERKRTKQTFQHLRFSQSVWNCGLLGWLFKSKYFQGSKTQPKEVQSLNKYLCGDTFA